MDKLPQRHKDTKLDERNGWRRLALVLLPEGLDAWSSARVGVIWRAVYQSPRAALTVWFFVEQHAGQSASHYLLTRVFRLDVDGREYTIPAEVQQNEHARYPGVHPYTTLAEATSVLRAAADADFRDDPIFAAIVRRVPTEPPPPLVPPRSPSSPPRHRRS